MNLSAGFLKGRGEVVSRLLLAAAVYVFFTIWDTRFATDDNFNTILDGFAFAGLAALGIGVTIIAGELDLSIGSLAAVAGVIAVQFAELGLILATVVAVAICAAFGVVQGLVIVRLRINSLVFTIGTLIALRGLAFILSGEKTIVVPDLAIADAIRRRLGIFSPFSLTTIVIFVLVGVFLVYHRWGREIYAIGGGRQEARAAGIGLYRPMAIAFGISAATAGLAGALVSLKSGSAAPIGFENLLLPAATAALIGGASLTGGKGSVIGIAVGAITIRFIVSGLSLQGAPFYVESLSLGVLLILVIIYELLVETPEAKARLQRWRKLWAEPPQAAPGA